MNDQIRNEIRALLPALKSLQTTVERAVLNEQYKGVGKMAVRTYSVLQSKIAALLPDDIYVTDALKLDITESDDEKSQVAQVNLAASQLFSYVKNLMQQDEPPFVNPEDWRELKNMGRTIKDQIMVQTRDALRRALQGLDDMPMPPVPPTPPTPPTPPMPPQPPYGARGKIKIEFGSDDDQPENPDKPDIV